MIAWVRVEAHARYVVIVRHVQDLKWHLHLPYVPKYQVCIRTTGNNLPIGIHAIKRHVSILQLGLLLT